MSSRPPTQTSFSQQAQEQRKPVIHLKAAVGIYASPPAHELNQKGSPAYYGSIPGVGLPGVSQPVGLQHLLNDGQTTYSMLNDVVLSTLTKVRLVQGTAAESDIIALAPWGIPVIWSSVGRYLGIQVTDAYGEMCTNQTLTWGGAITEAFTTAGTISQVTNGSGSITGAGTNFNNAPLPGYAYTPSLNKPRVGDVIFITQAATTYFHRITAVSGSPTALTTFPVWQGTTAGPGAGLAYGILRTGCGSRSRVVEIDNGATALLYYAGNTLARQVQNAGTLQAVKTVGGGTGHFMAPQAGAADAAANDCVLYKSFMLYGAGTAISWSVAGFPTSFATAFGATDLPAGNISVQDPSDEFVSFELLGDQCVAIFEHGAFLVRPTGTVPEFDFQRIPADPVEVLLCQQPQSGITVGVADSSGFCSAGVRPTTTGRKGIYYWGHGGLHRISQASGNTRLSVPMERYFETQFVNGPVPFAVDLSYEPHTGSICVQGYDQVAKGHTLGTVIFYSEEREDWGPICNPAAGGNVIASMSQAVKSSSVDPQNQATRGFNLAYVENIFGGANNVRAFVGPIEGGPGVGGGGAVKTWVWGSDIVFISDVYGDYGWGGFVPRIRAASGATSAILNWTLLGGRSPYQMVVRGSGTYDYAAGGPGALSVRDLIGGTIDDPYCAIVLSGTAWCELDGADVYPTDTPARR